VVYLEWYVCCRDLARLLSFGLWFEIWRGPIVIGIGESPAIGESLGITVGRGNHRRRWSWSNIAVEPFTDVGFEMVCLVAL